MSIIMVTEICVNRLSDKESMEIYMQIFDIFQNHKPCWM